MNGLVLDREPPLQPDETMLLRVRSNPLPYWLASGGFAVFVLGAVVAGEGLQPVEAILASAVMLGLTGIFVRTSRYYLTSRRVVHMQFNKERSVALADVSDVRRKDNLFGSTIHVKAKGLKRGVRIEYVVDPEPVMAALEDARRAAAPPAPHPPIE